MSLSNKRIFLNSVQTHPVNSSQPFRPVLTFAGTLLLTHDPQGRIQRRSRARLSLIPPILSCLLHQSYDSSASVSSFPSRWPLLSLSLASVSSKNTHLFSALVSADRLGLLLVSPLTQLQRSRSSVFTVQIKTTPLPKLLMSTNLKRKMLRREENSKKLAPQSYPQPMSFLSVITITSNLELTG